MRWPRRRKPAPNAAATVARTVDAPRPSPPARARPHAWRNAPPLVSTAVPLEPSVSRALTFARSVAGSRALTPRVVAPRPVDPHVVGLVHMPARPRDPASANGAEAEFDIAEFDAMLPPHMRAPRARVVTEPAPPHDLVHAPEPDPIGGAPIRSRKDEPPSPPSDGGPPDPGPPPLPAPQQMRVFRPRRGGLGEPLPPNEGPGVAPTPTDHAAPDPNRRHEPKPEGPGFDEAVRQEIDRAEARHGADGFTTEPVPSDLRTTLSNAFGVDVGSQPVQRGPAVTQRARALGARAYTQAGEVFVSDDVGPLAHTEARATVAHELTHVAQQRRLGPALPDEHTDAGRRLENAARSVERYVRGVPDTPRPTPELLHPDRAAAVDPDLINPTDYAEMVADELVRRGLAHRSSSGDLVVGPQPSSSTSAPSGIQRQPTATEEHTFATRMGNFGDSLLGGLRSEIGHVVLDEWNLDDETKHKFDIDNEVDLDERRHLREMNEQIDRENVNRVQHHLPALPAATALTDAQKAQIRQEVEHRFAARAADAAATARRNAASPTTPPGGGTPADPNAATSATETGADAAATTPATVDEPGAAAGGPARPHSMREFGEQVGMGLGAEVAGFYGLSELFEHETHTGQPASPTVAAATTTPAPTGTPAPGATPGGGTAAAAAAGGHDAHTTAGTHFSQLQDREVEELVRRVYARLRTTLRTELLVDRERAGMLADFR